MQNSVQNTSPYRISYILNIFGLLGVSAVLLVAFYYQLVKFELPCPLCLLQRVGIIMAGCGFLFNLRFGIKGTHYGMVLISCVVTGIIAARQMSLHILPGDVGYGSAFFSLHFYTWSLVFSILTICAVAIIMSVGDGEGVATEISVFPCWSKIVGWIFVILVAGNLVSTVLECGSGQCADNPTQYQLLVK